MSESESKPYVPKHAKPSGRRRKVEWPTVDPDVSPKRSEPFTDLPKRQAPSKWFKAES